MCTAIQINQVTKPVKRRPAIWATAAAQVGQEKRRPLGGAPDASVEALRFGVADGEDFGWLFWWHWEILHIHLGP